MRTGRAHTHHLFGVFELILCSFSSFPNDFCKDVAPIERITSLAPLEGEAAREGILADVAEEEELAKELLELRKKQPSIGGAGSLFCKVCGWNRRYVQRRPEQNSRLGGMTPSIFRTLMTRICFVCQM